MTDCKALIEAMARGMCEHVYPNCDFAPEGSVWVSTWAREREAFEEQATAALAAIEAMGAVVVPVEATEGMIEAAHVAMFETPFTGGTMVMVGAGLDAALAASPYAKEPT
jgi:hypothetical protein